MPRLTIELVPATCWFSNVRSSVSASIWESIRKKTSKFAKHRCEICGGRGRQWPVECHEVWHYNDEKHIQTLVRMTALCPLCHSVKHIGLASTRPGYEDVILHMMKINRWEDRSTAMGYIQQAYEVFDRRSRFEWQLDLSFLAQYGLTLRRSRNRWSRCR